MDNRRINEDFFKFVDKHQADDVNRLRLRRCADAGFDVDFAITQI